MQWLSGKPLENARLNFKKTPEFRKIRQISDTQVARTTTPVGRGSLLIFRFCVQFLQGSMRTPAGGLIEPVVIALSITERVTV